MAMSASSGSEDAFTSSQRAGLESRRTDQDRTLAAIHELERALESAAPGRETHWRDQVIAALQVLEEATAAESENASRPDGLLSDVARTQPRLRNRVRGLRTQYRQVQDRIAMLRPSSGRTPARAGLCPEGSRLRHRAAQSCLGLLPLQL
jgi:predicted AAA+ superfamily ATPase